MGKVSQITKEQQSNMDKALNEVVGSRLELNNNQYALKGVTIRDSYYSPITEDIEFMLSYTVISWGFFETTVDSQIGLFLGGTKECSIKRIQEDIIDTIRIKI